MRHLWKVKVRILRGWFRIRGGVETKDIHLELRT